MSPTDNPALSVILCIVGIAALAGSQPAFADAPPAAVTAPTGVARAKQATPKPQKPRSLMIRYPSTQFRQGTSGYVVAQFRLDEHGVPQDLKAVLADPKDAFEDAVLKTLRRVRFDVPPEWAARNPGRIMEMSFIFSFGRCVEKDLFPGMNSVIILAWPNRDAPGHCPEPMPAPG